MNKHIIFSIFLLKSVSRRGCNAHFKTLTWSQITTGAVSGDSAAGKNQKNMFPSLALSTVRNPA